VERDKEYIEGTIEEIIYSNELNGYAVCVVDFAGEMVTAVGTLSYIMEGEHIKAYGEWQVHPNFGRQFKVDVYEKEFPEGEDAVWKYLSSGAIKGVGPVTARRIVDRFGPDTLSVLENNCGWLAEVRGITPARAKEIGEAFAEQFGAREAMIFLNSYFSPALSVKIYRKYRHASPDIVRSNPYRLCDEVPGVGFKKADSLAQGLGFAPDSPERIEAGIKQTLKEAASKEGHCYLPAARLAERAEKLLGVGYKAIEDIAASCLASGGLSIPPAEKDGFCLESVVSAERYVSLKLISLSRNSLPFPVEGIKEQIEVSESKQGITYDKMQVEAIIGGVERGVSVVTGGPGTGKTTVIRAIIDIFESLGVKYQLAAPTGRAAKRMSEASGRDAKTIHRMLEMVYSEEDKPVFSRDENNPLSSRAFIIDETSMVDIFLMEAFLRAVKPDSTVVFIGDSDQLPPVGPGNALGDMISSDVFKVTKLERIFRQAEQSLIIVNAHRINSGKEPYLKNRGGDFFFITEYDPLNLQSLLCSLCGERLPAAYGFNPIDDIQVITPTKRGECGTRELNRLLQSKLNPQNIGKIKSKREKKIADTLFREGDKVMQVKNNYDIAWKKDGDEGSGVFNGDIGRVKAISYKTETITVDFDGRVCEYSFSEALDLELAYAVTVHKSQGSEYPAVILPILRCPPPLTNRSLLYTAVTRAKALLIAVGDPALLAQMVENNKRDERYTSLKHLLTQNNMP